MKIKSILSHAVAKPVVAGLTAGLLDRFLMNNTNTKSNLMFAGAVGAGIFSVSWVEPVMTKMFPTKTPIGHIGKALEGRVIEIACGSAAAYGLNYFVLKNEYSNRDMLYKLGLVVAGDLAGEMVSELLMLK